MHQPTSWRPLVPPSLVWLMLAALAVALIASTFGIKALALFRAIGALLAGLAGR